MCFFRSVKKTQDILNLSVSKIKKTYPLLTVLPYCTKMGEAQNERSEKKIVIDISLGYKAASYLT